MKELAEDRILQVHSLKKYYPLRRRFGRTATGYIKAVDGISFDVYQGEVFGLVGESGCGKTTTAHMICRSIEATDGSILFKTPSGAVDMVTLPRKQLKEVRPHVQMVFQDPYQALSPRMSIADIIAEPLECQGVPRNERKERVAELMDMVGLNPDYMVRYPHAFSGGQRQRIGIARAMALSPSLILADEPVSALDVSVQAQILNLIIDLKQKHNTTYIFIGHDLGVIRYVCDRIAVMYLGKIVELAENKDLFDNPKHPYTLTLLEAVPDADPHQQWMANLLTSEAPLEVKDSEGCKFAPRCKYADDRCYAEEPELRDINSKDGKDGRHYVACHNIHLVNQSVAYSTRGEKA